MDIWKELREEGVDAALLEEIRHFREGHPVLTVRGGAGSAAALSILWQGDMGRCGGGPAVRGASAAGRPQGHRENVLAGKSGGGILPPGLGRVHVCECGTRRPLIGADTLQEGQVVFREGPVSKSPAWAALACWTR